MERYIDNDDRRLWTTAEGIGVPLVLCSGGPGCCDYLGPVAQMLDGLAQVIRFDALGCGRSALAPEYSVETCLADLEAIRHAYGFDKWIVAGHSWGADLALIYAMHYPQHVLGFICLAGGRIHNDREWHKTYEQGRDQGLETLPVFDYPPNMDVNRQVIRSWKQYIQHPTLLKELAILRAPALFLYGDRDIRPSWPVQQVANLLPKAEFVLLRGADHHLWLGHAAELQSALRSFIIGLVQSNQSFPENNTI